MSIGERLKTARKKNRISQDDLARLIGVSRGVISNIEYGKVKDPQLIVIDAIVKELKIRMEWLLTGCGEMDDNSDTLRSAQILAELYEVAKDLSENELLYLLDNIKAMKKRLGDGDSAH